MNGMIAALRRRPDADMANYFSAQKLKGKPPRTRSRRTSARSFTAAGDQSKGLPACAACHGPAGAGIPAQYPRIGGQFAEYTEAQLKAFRDGVRANDPNKMMRMVAIKMTDAEIKAVSDYIAGLR
jgi:cytochrome c553